AGHHAPRARTGHKRRVLASNRLAGSGYRVLLDLSGRLLRDQHRVRDLPDCAACPRDRAKALMFAHDFVRNAYLAGTFIALACGFIGWFAVLRGQVFAGDALSHVAFVGAIAAAVLGLDERLGLFALTLVVALGLAGLGRRAQADDVVIGTTFAWTLGIGLLLLAVLATSSGGGNGVAAANTL